MNYNDLVSEAKSAGLPLNLVLFRHGEAICNANDAVSIALRKTTPEPESPLTPNGQRDAERAGRFIPKNFDAFDSAYDSGQTRTVQTLDFLLGSYSLKERKRIKRHTDPLLRERSVGKLYNMPDDIFTAKYPDFYKTWYRIGPYNAPIPEDGESMHVVCERVSKFIKIKLPIQAGKSVLIATHGGPIKAFRFVLENWSIKQFNDLFNVNEPGHCRYTHYKFDPKTKKLKLVVYNYLCQ